MRPPRSVLAVLGLIAVLALPAGAQGATKLRAAGLQVKVKSVNAKSKTLKARVVTATTGLTKYKNKTLTFSIKGVALTIVDRNNNAKGNEVGDILKNDLLGLIVAVPKSGALPKVIAVKSLQDLTALQSTPNLPGVPSTPTLPTIPGLPHG